MKRFLLVFTLIILFLTSSVQARTVKAISVDAFSTAYPAQNYSVQLLSNERFKEGVSLQAGTILSGNVVQVRRPKRGKRNGNFEFVVSSITYNGVTKAVKNRTIVIQILGYTPIDPGGLAVFVAKRASNFVFMGASFGIAFTEGFIQGEDESRYKSGFKKMYKDSPLAYVEVGNDLDVHKGDIVILKFKKIH